MKTRHIWLTLWMLMMAISATHAATDVSYLQDISNYQPGGKKFMLSSDGTEAGKELAIDWDKQYVKAVIDLSKCSDNEENVLSIGNSIDIWANNSVYRNIHFYYTKKDSLLVIDLKDSDNKNPSDSDGKYEKKWKHIYDKLYLELRKEGLYINGKKETYYDDAKLKNLLTLGRIQLGSIQTKTSNATYEQLCIDNKMSRQLLTSETCFNPNSEDKNQFYFPDEENKNISINLKKQYIEAKLDLNSCGTTSTINENILSIGENINVWKGRHVHFYYTPSSKQLVIDVANTSGGKTEKQMTLTSNELTIKLSNDGIYVNDALEISSKDDNLSPVLGLNQINIGSIYVDVDSKTQVETPIISHATYKEVNIYDEVEQPAPIILSTTEEWANFEPSGNFFYTTQGIDLTKKALKVKIDLTNCSSSKFENILSIGNSQDAIANWGGTGWYTIHIYYKNNSNKELQVNYQNASISDENKSTIYLQDNTLNIELQNKGLFINGELFKGTHTSSGTTSEITYDASKLANLLNNRTSLTFGSMDNNGSTQAKYINASIEEPSQTEPVDERLISLPWKNKAGEGKDFYSTTDIDFEKQYIEATIDLSTCQTNEVSNKSYETILSIGNQIAEWDGTGVYNLHLYYSKKDKKLEADFLNSSTNNKDRTQDFVTDLEPGLLKVKLSKEGLYLNNKLSEKITAEKLTNLLTLKEIQIGNLQGDLRSYATYQALDVKNSDFNVSWISDQTKFEDNKEVAHATYIPYASTSDMKNDADFYHTPWVESKSSLVKNLNTVNGDEWKFCYVKGTTNGPGASDFFAKDFEQSSEYVAANWKTIRVPLSWEMAGYGRPVYTNIGYPFDAAAPLALKSSGNNQESDNNATGFYRRNFTIGDGWKDKRIFLHFDGVYSAAVVWVDGKYVGYTQGSNNDAEFDITAALDKASDGSNILTGEGSNNEHQLSVRVYRWCDGSYLEGQDAWHLSGIHRDVYLVAKPKVFVSDAVITSNLSDNATSGKLNVALTIDNRDMVAGVSKRFTVSLSDKDGKTIGIQEVTYEIGSTPTDTEKILEVEFTGLTSLHPWTAETPYLYNVCVSQSDADGSSQNEEMAFNTKYGFRKITPKSKLVYINGKRVFFKGVNTQDTHPEYGRAIDVETMMKDLTMMKRANINTVRTSHYPRQAKMYAMMDALGFYVMDEADVECHYYWINSSDHLTSNESWSAQYVDRNERMVKRDRNHPSIIFWSLGNESGDGDCMTNAYQAVKNLDSERPIHYEGTFNKGYTNVSNTNTNNNSDLYSDMYPTVSSVSEKMAGDNTYGKPYFICEYAHAMGQAVGNLKEYWDAIEGSSAIIGGCIWDWVDQAIYKTESGNGVVADKTDNKGFHHWTAGYDYNTTNGGHQGNFLDNGLVTPDRRWSGKLTEVKKVYQYVKFSDFDASNKTVKVENKFGFTDISDDQFVFAYKILKNGRLVEEGKVDNFTTIKASATGELGEAGSISTITLPYVTTVEDNAEYLINVELRNKKKTDWAEAGYNVADAQFSISPQQASSDIQGTDGTMGNPSLPSYQAEAGNTFTIDDSSRKVSGTDKNGKAFTISFDENGKMTEWNYDGKNLLNADGNNVLASGAAPDFNSMRNTDNDIKCYITQVNHSSLQITKSLSEATSETSDGKNGSDANKAATMSVEGTATNCTYTIDYTFYPDAVVDMKVTFTPSGATRRLGLGMQFANGFENVEYYARGPWSNYSDRKTGSYLGRYTTTVDDMIEEEVHPQTYGDHQDLRELILSNQESGMQIGIQVAGHVSFSLSHYDETLWCGEGSGNGTGLKDISTDQQHWYGMTKFEQVFAHFDYWQRGLGNRSCSAEESLKDYRCPTSGSYTYTLRFKPSTFEKTNF